MIVLGGPYIGSFEQEIITFRPYMRWLYDCMTHEEMYISSHSNRAFLYDFIKKENFLPVYENLSRDEKGQRGYIHSEVSSRDYQILLKDVKDRIVERQGCSKKDLDVYNLSYVKSTPPKSIYRKHFDPISAGEWIPDQYKDKVIFIPANTECKETLSKVRDYLRQNSCLIIGDTKTRFRNENMILSKIDYFENGFRWIVKMMTVAKAVICPASFWTAIANLQGVPVFSWGKNVSQYRVDGIYHFDNYKGLALASRDAKTVVRMMEYFLKGVYN